MPKPFEACVKRGGRVRTLKPKGKKSSTYLRICCDSKTGKCYRGEVKHAKKE